MTFATPVFLAVLSVACSSESTGFARNAGADSATEDDSGASSEAGSSADGSVNGSDASASALRYDCTKNCFKMETDADYRTRCKKDQDEAIAKGCNAPHYALVTCAMREAGAVGRCNQDGTWNALNVCMTEFSAYQTCVFRK
jgi:hypothetical protein